MGNKDTKKTTLKDYLLRGIKLIIPLFFGIYLFNFIYKDTEWGKVMEVLRSGMHWEWIIATFIVALLAHYFRAVRWKMLTCRVKEGISTYELFNAVLLGYGVNLIFPRLGEVSRCLAIAKKENLPFTTLFGTLLSERLVDVLVVLLVAILAVTLQFNYFHSNMVQYGDVVDSLLDFFSSSYFLCIIMVLFLAVLLLMKGQSSVLVQLRHLFSNLWEGMQTLLKVKDKMGFIVLSLLVWFMYLLQLYFCILAFDFTSHLHFDVILVLYTVGMFSYLLPVQGGIGTWHFAIILTLQFYGIEEEGAKLFALVSHSAPTLVMVFGGIWAYIWFAFLNKKRVLAEE